MEKNIQNEEDNNIDDEEEEEDMDETRNSICENHMKLSKSLSDVSIQLF
jgi:hypothetical protein